MSLDFLQTKLTWALSFAVTGLLITTPTETRAFDLKSAVYIECTLDQSVSRGSGAVIDAEGRVLSAKHVVEKVWEADGGECKGALGTQSDPNELKLLTIRHVAENRDVALMQFVDHEVMEFARIPFAGPIDIDAGMQITAFGFHPLNTGTADRSDGQVISAAVLANGKIKVGLNTTRGMSGGPVLFNDRLIGIIANEQFDPDGQPLATHFVSADEFPEAIRRRLVDQDSIVTNHALAEHLALDDVCTQLLREQISLRQDRFPEAAQIASNMVEAPSSHLTDTAEYWVTVTTGPARWADCRTGNMLKALYFPTGLMLRPERDVIIRGEVHTLFVTEHGLRIFLDREAIEPVTPDVGYVFATANGVFQVCTRNDTDCDPLAEYRITEHDEHWPFLSGYQSYLRSDAPDELDAARKALEAMYEYQVDPPDPRDALAVQLDLSDPDSLEACAIREARLYTFFMRYDPDHEQKGSAYQHPVKYSLCTVNNGTAFNRFERIKLVTVAAAEARFSQLWAVNTIRQMPENMQAVTRALFGVERPMANVITCSENRFDYITAGEAARRGPTSLEDIVASDSDDAVGARRHSVFRQFQIAQASSPVDVFTTAPLFNDIELSATCGDDNEIKNAGEIIVDLAPLSDGLTLELKLLDLYGVLNTSFENNGMVDADILNRRLREGIMYRVCDYHEYIIWRTILFNAIKDSERVRQAKEAMGVELNLMTDHITHLIMASVFSTDTKLQTEDRRKEGCV